MIRRDADRDWLLIAQADHARIAAAIAGAWRFPPGVLESHRSELIEAVRGHDDGWPAWEASPTIDPESGKPREFTEMPMNEATRIWTESIRQCGERSPWGGLWVSRHFCRLAHRALENRESASDVDALHAFLDQQARLRETHRSRLPEGPNVTDLEEKEDAGFLWVQFFDFVSLWICCAERTQPHSFSVPGGGSATAIPEPGGAIRLDGDRLSRSPVTLETKAIRIPAQSFDSDEDFRSALRNADRASLTWNLVCEHD